MRRINLLAFAITLAAGTTLQLGHPASAAATLAPSPVQWTFCCERGQTQCCGMNWCAVTATGCAKG
jgi:hypothetical protein